MKKCRRINFWETAELIPPILARLLARHKNGPPLTDAEIAAKSGLTADAIFLRSHQCSWDSVDLSTMRKFLTGCGIDFCDGRAMNRVKSYLTSASRGRPTCWKYLRTSKYWKSRFEPLMKRYLESLQTTNQT